MAFDTARAWVHTQGDSVQLLVEVARTDAQKQYGLTGRSSLDPGSGMVFLYDTVQGGGQGFWMWRTLIPLDIAFLDPEGSIVAILHMDPCQSPNPDFCEIHSPGLEYASALEVNRGWFAEHGVEPGSRVVVEPRPGGEP